MANSSVLIVIALLAFAFPARAQSLDEFTRLTIADSRDVIHEFSVELADTPEERSKGLMFREELPANGGMLFVWKGENEAFRSFWMRNTLIPLDMLFIRRNGIISSVHQRAIPHDETPIPSTEPVYAVLELPGGTAEALGIGPGDQVIHPIFANGLAE